MSKQGKAIGHWLTRRWA